MRKADLLSEIKAKVGQQVYYFDYTFRVMFNFQIICDNAGTDDSDTTHNTIIANTDKNAAVHIPDVIPDVPVSKSDYFIVIDAVGKTTKIHKNTVISMLTWRESPRDMDISFRRGATYFWTYSHCQAWVGRTIKLSVNPIALIPVFPKYYFAVATPDVVSYHVFIDECILLSVSVGHTDTRGETTKKIKRNAEETATTRQQSTIQ